MKKLTALAALFMISGTLTAAPFHHEPNRDHRPNMERPAPKKEARRHKAEQQRKNRFEERKAEERRKHRAEERKKSKPFHNAPRHH